MQSENMPAEMPQMPSFSTAPKKPQHEFAGFFIVLVSSLALVSIILNNTIEIDKKVEARRVQHSAVAVNTSAGDVVYCAADAKQCPDGSYVSRVAPRCEFKECGAQGNTTVVNAPQSSYIFPSAISSKYDVQDDLTSGQMIVPGAGVPEDSLKGPYVSLRARDMFILDTINSIIGSQVDANAQLIEFPVSLRLDSDGDRKATNNKWVCSGAYMTERDDALLAAINDIRQGKLDPQNSPLVFNGKSESSIDNAAAYTNGQCFSENVSMEGRDRFLRDVINQLLIK